jgi:hypothetical protein
MDKLTGIIDSQNYAQPKKKVNQPGGDLFKQSFAKALAGQTNNSAGSSQEVQSLRTLGEIQPLVLAPFKTGADPIVKKADKLLDLMDSYAKGLENPQKSLRDLESQLLMIKDGSEKLINDMEKGVNLDEGLKNIVNECALTANVEWVKFQRGDYV